MMDSFPLKSGVFLLVALFFGLCAIICHGKQCNPAIEYSACDKKTGKVLACPKCRACKPGFEPIIPCGTVIDIGVTIGICRPCKDGHYSATKDVYSCKICQGSKCSVHEKVAGTCKKDWYDTSYCTGDCEDGYVMNNDKTRCENVSILEQKTTKYPAAGLSRPETNEELPLEIIIPCIIIGLFLLVILPLIGLYHHFKSRQRELNQQNDLSRSNGFHVEETPIGYAVNARQSNNNSSGDITSNTAAPQCEQNKQSGLLTSTGPHVPETTRGYVNSSPSSND